MPYETSWNWKWFEIAHEQCAKAIEKLSVSKQPVKKPNLYRTERPSSGISNAPYQQHLGRRSLFWLNITVTEGAQAIIPCSGTQCWELSEKEASKEAQSILKDWETKFHDIKCTIRKDPLQFESVMVYVESIMRKGKGGVFKISQIVKKENR